ncbi:MAG: polysaccharide deacetylase family protein [Deltaproteobacteria bacterium]|nr:polysaccharide deacetylase family protein [Deltaproteobacteria bacterium]
MRLRELSIIQYQNISTDHHMRRLWISIDAFKKQLKYLASNNFVFLSMDEAIKYMEREKRINKARPISLTFDNGYQDFYKQVWPLLSDYHIPCTVLISPEKVGKRTNIGEKEAHYLTWDNLREMANNNITIGAYEDYTWNINDMPEDMVQRHIIDYKKMMEDRLGVEILYFGVKEGVPNNKIRDLLISNGYKAFLTECPTNRGPDLYSIGRIQVDDNDFNIFMTKISRTYLFFKDRKSWKYIREYSLDKVAHKLSETFDRMRGVKVT